MSEASPCTRCGACCAWGRVSFPARELASREGAVPDALVLPRSPGHVMMRGSDQAPPRCVALRGEVGQQVSCAIYAVRPEVCRELPPAWEGGAPSPRCDEARAAAGMAPLPRPESSVSDSDQRR